MLSLSLISCATNGPENKIEVIDTSCRWVNPIYISENDTISYSTAIQILKHNETWAELCSKVAPTEKAEKQKLIL